MKFLKKIAFCLTLISITFVECDPNRRQKRLDQSPNEDYLSVTLASDEDMELTTVETACSQSIIKLSNKLHGESICRSPRKRLVNVKMPSKYYMPGVFIRPTMYEVERCDGACNGHANHKCLPIETEMIEIPVAVTPFQLQSARIRLGALTTPVDKCMTIKIEKHKRCGCRCYMSQKNCNERQVFSPGGCACMCKDTSKAATCAEINRMWSMEKCDCVCPPTASRHCSSGAVFDENTCRCMQTNGTFE